MDLITPQMIVCVINELNNNFMLILHIDLVLIDPQSVVKRTHDLMYTVNAKKRWKTIYWRVNKYLK
jgi:hypothetical protein